MSNATIIRPYISNRRLGMGSYSMGVVLAAVGTIDDTDEISNTYTNSVQGSDYGNSNISCVGTMHSTSSVCSTQSIADHEVVAFTLQATPLDSIRDKQDSFRALLASAYAEDRDSFMRNIMSSGAKTTGDNANKAAYMTGLTWLWEMHPDTFLECAAPYIGDNSCYTDLLTLMSVITFNRSFPMEILSNGVESRTSLESKRVSLRLKEKTIWNNLLAAFGVKSEDVVRSRSSVNITRSRKNRVSYPAPLRREYATTASDDLSYVSSPATPKNGDSDLPTVPLGPFSKGNTATYVFGSRPVSSHDRTIVTTGYNKKNIWLNEAFKLQWQSERSKLHRNEYAKPTGVAGTGYNYEKLVDFVVSCFASGITTNNYVIAQCSPMPGCLYDRGTKGVDAFKGRFDSKIPVSWGHSSGISQAIAFKLYGGLLEQRMFQDSSTGATAMSVDAQKMYVVKRYKDAVSRICENSS